MSTSPIRLDGSEGGGLLLRSALGLSLVTGKPFTLERAGGPGGGGLDAAMLACVRAARAVGGAAVEGDWPGSERLDFAPGPVRRGDYLLDLGAAGSIPQALQVIAVPLALAGPSVVKLRGGTHFEADPALHYLTLVWLPLMRELGYELDLELNAAGFGPQGGGEATLQLHGARLEKGLDCRSRGTLREVRVLSTVSGVPLEVARRQSETAVQRLKERGIPAEAENIPVPAPRSRGSMCLVVALFEWARAGFVALGGEGADPEAVGARAAEACVEFVRSRAAFDLVLAEQLVLPMAVAASGLASGAHPVCRFSTSRLSDALLVEAATTGRFLEVEVALLAGGAGAEAEVRVAHARESLMQALRPRPPREP